MDSIFNLTVACMRAHGEHGEKIRPKWSERIRVGRSPISDIILWFLQTM